MRAIPKTYSGVRFRSTLEADWAKNMDDMTMAWQYEPEGVVIGPRETFYRPDMYLPLLTTWVEVKGPHNERLDKASLLQADCLHEPTCARTPCTCGFGAAFPWRLVVVARPATSGKMTFHGAPCDDLPNPQIVIAHCGVCKQMSFADTTGAWKCRRCHQSGAVNVWPSGRLPFIQIDHKAGQYRKRRKSVAPS